MHDREEGGTERDGGELGVYVVVFWLFVSLCVELYVWEGVH